jgi:hypothetical protein
MTAGSNIGYQPHPLPPTDIEEFREFQRLQRQVISNNFFNNTRFSISDKLSMDKIKDEYRDRYRRVKNIVY